MAGCPGARWSGPPSSGFWPKIVGAHLRQPDLAPRLVPDLAAREVGQVQAGLYAMAALCDPGARGMDWTDLIARARFDILQVGLTLQKTEIAARLGVDPDRLNKSELSVIAPSRLKRRGHELRLVIGETSPNPDPTLAANMLKAQGWYAAIKSGQRIAEIARAEGIGEARIRQLLPLAFLVPGLVTRIAEGRQPIWFTTEYVKRNGWPVDWREQRELLDTRPFKTRDRMSPWGN